MYVRGHVPTHGAGRGQHGVSILSYHERGGVTVSFVHLRTDLFDLFWDVWWSLKPVLHPASVSEEQDEAGSRQHQQQCEDAQRNQDGLLQPGGV